MKLVQLGILQSALLIIGVPLTNSACIFDGKSYEPFTVVYKVYEESNDWCRIGLCRHDGAIWKLVDLTCRRKSTDAKMINSTTTIPLPTTPVKTTPPVRCIYEGREYSPGTEIFRGLDETKSKCFTIICTLNGDVVTKEKKRCRMKRPMTEKVTKRPGTKTRYVTVKRTTVPATVPTTHPTTLPTTHPTTVPTTHPTTLPTTHPTTVPTTHPTTQPTTHPTTLPTTHPTTQPTTHPTTQPTTHPTTLPTTHPTTVPTTDPTTLPTTTQPTTLPTTPRGCYENGKFYPPGTSVSEGYYESSDWCYGSICDENGFMLHWDNWNCKGRYTPTMPFPTTLPPSTPPRTTVPKSKTEPPTTKPITSREPTTTGRDDRMTTNPSTESSTRREPPTELFRTTPPFHGCVHNGQFYQPGEKFGEGYDESSDWCYGMYCNSMGGIVNWDTWNCKRGKPTTEEVTTVPEILRTTEATTTSMLTDTTTAGAPLTRKEETFPSHPPGCYDNGKSYPPGTSIYEGFDEASNWCYGQYCDDYGDIISWDTWECKKTTSPPTTSPLPPTTEMIPTTAESTTIKTTATTTVEMTTPKTPLKCTYQTVHYSAGDVVYMKYDGRQNWCYGLVCSEEGKLTYWDKWECKGVTTPKAPSVQELVASATSGRSKTGKKKAAKCSYKGVDYSTRQFIEKVCGDDGKCSVLFCNSDGIVVPKILSDFTRKGNSEEDKYIFGSRK